jgi:DNA-binding MarR family transcriptional regulator
VTNTIDGLERLELVVRRPHEHDRRMTLAAITDRGRAVAREATEALNAARFAMAPLADDELDGLASTLRRIRLDEGDFDDMR